MAVAIDASTPAAVTGTATTKTTASFTPPAQSLVVAFNVQDSAGGASNDATFTSSDSASWTLIARVSTGNNSGTTASVEAVYHYYDASPGAITVSQTMAVTGKPSGALFVMVFTGAGRTVTNFATSASALSNTITGTVTTKTQDGLVVAVCSDWSNVDSPDEHSSAAGQAWQFTPYLSAQVWGGVMKRSATDNTGTAVTMLTPTSGALAPQAQYNMVTMEIPAAMGRGPVIVGPSRAVQRSVSW